MSYEYDENNGLQPKPPKKNDNDLGSWIFIAVMFAVAWPVGLILLLSKLSEGGGRKMRQQARNAWQRTAAGSAEAKPAQARASAAKNTVRKVTETPNYSDKGAKVMKIIGAAVAILGAFFLVQQVDYFELRYAIKWHEWMDLLRQVFAQGAVWNAAMPGKSSRECGNYNNLDVALARECCAFYADIIDSWTVEKLVYPE